MEELDDKIVYQGDINMDVSSVPAQVAVSVQKSAMKSDEAILNKLYESVSENPAPRPSGLSTGHNLNVAA